MRDISKATEVSLSGLYYYFDSKQRLLYLIQKNTFTFIVERLQERFQGVPIRSQVASPGAKPHGLFPVPSE